MKMQMKMRDIHGKELSPDVIYMAHKKNGDGTFTVYRRRPDEIKRLVADMRADGITDKDLLSEQYWQKGECNMQTGDCSEQTCGGGGVCRLSEASGYVQCRCIL